MKIINKRTEKLTKLHSIICPTCKELFGSYKNTSKYCSKQCAYLGITNSKKRGETRICIICKENFYSKKSDDRRGSIRKYCSRSCRHLNKKLNLPIGQYYSYDGYVVLNKIEDGRKQIKLHRYIMERSIGRILLPTEIVHHIDENKLNNLVSNLVIVSRSEHNLLHKNNSDRMSFIKNKKDKF